MLQIEVQRHVDYFEGIEVSVLNLLPVLLGASCGHLLTANLLSSAAVSFSSVFDPF